jgi:hypothetical protein
MAYFHNNTVNLLNLHYAIHALALTGGGAFFVIFLLKSGVPAAVVLAAVAAILPGLSCPSCCTARARCCTTARCRSGPKIPCARSPPDSLLVSARV